ncbi:MAG TPA: hypothetical protein V6C98_14485 [Thermosynechococcaceae cyanobacterium]
MTRTILHAIKASGFRGLLPQASPLLQGGQALCSLLLLTAVVLPSYTPPRDPPPRRPPTSFTGSPQSFVSVPQNDFSLGH